MEKPTSLSFTDFEVPVSDLLSRNDMGPMNLGWTRVQFTMPDDYDAPKHVETWLRENCPGEWQAYRHPNLRGKTNDYVMVVRFENKNDALMFKLRDGHKAWEGR